MSKYFHLHLHFINIVCFKSGLIARPDQLLIALEPEAASFYCKKQTFAKLDTVLPLKNGIRYIVLDLGGNYFEIFHPYFLNIEIIHYNMVQ